MAANKKPSDCRKYKDKIEAHMKHQNETENNFSAIMAEMEELKQCETKPVLIKSCHSATQSRQKTATCLSMPDMRQFSSCDPQDCGGYERQSRHLQPPPLQYNGGGIIHQHWRERREPPLQHHIHFK